MRFPVLISAFLLVLAALATPAAAEEFTITIKDHKFEPAELQVPAGEAFTLKVVNADKTPEEFESLDWPVEKVIPGGTTAIVNVAPLEPGTYEFFGEFHMDTALGKLIAK